MQFFNSWFNLILIAVFGVFAYRFLKFGGLLGAFFGSRVSRTIGKIDLGLGAGSALRVHQLENGNIVVEQSSRVLLGAPTLAFPLNRDNTIRLIALLNEAANA
jgi:hypothetical protein